MTQVPENILDVNAALMAWESVKVDKAKATYEESRLRKLIFAHFFPNAKEGTNTAPLANGWKVKGTQAINRNVDAAILQALGAELTEKAINAGLLVKWSPEISVTEYRKLTAEQKLVFDRCLTIKEGSVTLEIVPPKEPK